MLPPVPQACKSCGHTGLRLEHETRRRENVRITEDGVGGSETAAFVYPVGVCPSCGDTNELDGIEDGRSARFDVAAYLGSLCRDRLGSDEPWIALSELEQLTLMQAELRLQLPVLQSSVMHTTMWIMSILAASSTYQIHPIQLGLMSTHIATDLEQLVQAVTAVAPALDARIDHLRDAAAGTDQKDAS